MPRKINKGFTELDFIPVKKENKYFAYCTYCGHELSNTAFCRLQAHRSICKNKNTAQEIATCSNVNENSEIVLQNNTEKTISNEIKLDNMATGLESSQLIEFVTSNSIHNDKMDIQVIDITNQNNASSAQIERVFSSWSFVHSPIRNRLDFERSRKLLHIYYTHKITDSNICNDY